jgi:hypothetical protein
MASDLTGIIICFVCKEIDDIPNYTPAEADRDPRIGMLLEVHTRRHPSVENRVVTEWASLGSVPTEHWNNSETKKEIKKKILEGNGLTGFDAEFYATKETFKEDALKCFTAHGRPSYKNPGCQDYLSNAKELKPNTAIERKAAGLPTYDETKIKRSFLCEHCPYHSDAISKIRIERAKK